MGTAPTTAATAAATRPDWLESTKHTRRRRPRVALSSGSRKKRNPWLVGVLVWGGVAVLVGAVVLGVHAWQERDRIVMPDTIAGLVPATDPDLVDMAEAVRAAMAVDPKAEGSRYESVAYGDVHAFGVVTVFPMGSVFAESDLASIVDANSDLLFGDPEHIGDISCTTGDSGSGVKLTWCFRSGPDYSVIVMAGPDGDVSRAVLMVREAYAAQR